MAYTQHGVVPIQLTNGSPSFLPNNLTCHGDHLAYVRNSDVIVLTNGAPAKIQGNRSFAIQSASFVTVRGATYLAVASSTGYQLWTPNGDTMAHFFHLSSVYPGAGAENGALHVSSVSGAAGYICAGCSTGDLLISQLSSGGGEMELFLKLESRETKDDAITATAMSTKYVITGNESSTIVAYSVMEAFEKLWQVNLPAESVGDRAPVTSLIVRDETVVAGFVTGHIRIYRANIGELAIEICAHVRPVMGLSLHPRDNVFASCSEDQHAALWVFPDFESRSSSVVDCLSTHKFPNRMLTGIAFLPQDRLAVASYDDTELPILRKE